MQHGDEYRALDRKFKGAVLQQISENHVDPESFPDPAQQERAADAFGQGRERAVGVLLHRVDEQDLAGELGARGEQRGERAGRLKVVGATEIGDDELPHRAVDALVLDDLDVGAFARPLETEEHYGSNRSTTTTDSPLVIKSTIRANVAPRFEKIATSIQ